MRDIIVHHYFVIDLNLVWESVEEGIGPLEEAVQKMLARIQ